MQNLLDPFLKLEKAYNERDVIYQSFLEKQQRLLARVEQLEQHTYQIRAEKQPDLSDLMHPVNIRLTWLETNYLKLYKEAVEKNKRGKKVCTKNSKKK